MTCLSSHSWLVAEAQVIPHLSDSGAPRLVPCDHRALTPTPGSFLSLGGSGPGPWEAVGWAWGFTGVSTLGRTPAFIPAGQTGLGCRKS